VAFIRTNGADAVAVCLPVGRAACTLMLGGDGGAASGSTSSTISPTRTTKPPSAPRRSLTTASTPFSRGSSCTPTTPRLSSPWTAGRTSSGRASPRRFRGPRSGNFPTAGARAWACAIPPSSSTACGCGSCRTTPRRRS